MALWHHGFVRTGVVLAALAAFLSVGFVGVYRYVDGYWLYRGFPRPHDPAFVHVVGRAVRTEVASAALGGRRQPVDVYLPPGYGSHPRERYPVLYLLHGEPGRPGAFLMTVRLGVVEDELTALHRARPLILVMPFGSTGSFVDKEWANGVGPHEGWESFVAHDLVRAVDARFRTIRSDRARGIGGLSEGGYGAINIAIHHPGEFGLVESWSGYEKADDLGSRSRSASRPSAGCTPCVPPACPAPACGKRCRSTSSQGTPRRHSCGSSRSGRSPRCCLRASRVGRASSVSVRRCCSRSGRPS